MRCENIGKSSSDVCGGVGAPFISVIIANYNYGRFLEEAILSILRQSFGSKVEIIICDAASTDNSVEIIKKYENQISWWCSEPDSGQSEAFNKGFSHAKGEWLTWLNADEVYLPKTFSKLQRFAEKHPHAEWIGGNDLIFDDVTRKVTYVKWGPHWQPAFLKRQHASFAVFGPTSFFKRSLYSKIGPIDESLHYAMDFDYWIRFVMAEVRQYRFNHHCWAFRTHESSKTSGDRAKRMLKERSKEFEGIQNKNRYWYKHRISNLWYCIMMLLRLLDGSLMVRQWKKWTMQGRCLDEFL